MVWVETNKESPTDLSIKDHQTLKQEYGLMEFTSNVTEERSSAEGNLEERKG